VLNCVLDQFSSVPARKSSGPEGPHTRSVSAPTEASGLNLRAKACNPVCDFQRPSASRRAHSIGLPRTIRLGHWNNYWTLGIKGDGASPRLKSSSGIKKN
jgi:hypothetical protein